MDIVLVNAPYFRLVGSHNDRAPLSLCYLSAYLARAGVEHRVFNSEHTGADAYWRWGALGRHFDLFRQGVDGHSPVYFELAERIMSYSPKAVVVGIGDPMLASVGLGNAWAGYWLAKALKEAGCPLVYGFGQYVTLDADRWLAKAGGVYDGMLMGEPGETVVELARAVSAGVPMMGKISGAEFGCDVIPVFDYLEPAGQKADVVMSSIGCAWRCTFCLSPKVTGKFKFIDVGLVAQDFDRRPPGKVFWGDMVFPVNHTHLSALADELEKIPRRESICESRVDTIDDMRCETLARIGVIGCKLGVESISQGHLDAINKRSNKQKIEAAVATLRRHDLKFIAYVMLGGPGGTNETAKETYEWLVDQGVDYTIVSTYSDDGVGSEREYRYDAHFSPDCLERWGIDPEWLTRFNGLQKNRGVSKLGKVIG